MHPAKFWHLFLILLLAAFGAEMVYLATLDPSLWGDEFYCVLETALPWRGVLHGDPGNPPLYPLMLKLVVTLFGGEPWKMKLLSGVPLILAAACGARFLRREFSVRAAILFVLCLAATWLPAHYAIEVRAYGWAFFFVLMTALSAWSVGKNGRRRDWAQFLFFAVCAAFTHYYALLTCAWGYLLLLGYVAKYDRRQIRAALLTAAGAALAFGWYVPIAVEGASSSSIVMLPPFDFQTVIGYMRSIFAVGEYAETLQTLNVGGILSLLDGNIAATALLAAMFGAVLFRQIRRSENTGGGGGFPGAGLATYGLVVATGLSALWLIRPIITNRYLFPAVGLLWLFFAIAGANLTRRSPRLFAGLCGVLLLFGALTFTAQARYENVKGEQFFASVGYLTDEIANGGGTVFLVTQGATHKPGWWVLQIYIRGDFIMAKDARKWTPEAVDVWKGKPAWILANPGEKLAVPPTAAIEFCRSVNLDLHDHDLYHTPDAAAVLPYLRD
ncbi:MAG: glycosyltransferase family 39 protein [Planctomycetota bacterium]|nr:glycosyltransferase family 39 protein [Planctomycetota bacterium]